MKPKYSGSPPSQPLAGNADPLAQDNNAGADGEDTRLGEIAVESFPLSVLPTALSEFVEEAARAISCPPDYIAVPMLAVLATAIGTRRRIQIKEGWCEWPILWTATVGHTGTAKSPGQEKAIEPLVRLQNKLFAKFKEDTALKWSADKAAAHPRNKAVGRPRASGKAAGPEKEARDVEAELPSKVPTRQLQQVFTTDATLEALNLCLESNPQGIALNRDELTAWVLGMNEYKKGSGADRPHWQAMWNGSPIIVNRKNRAEPITIPQPFVCVVGGLPPDMLGELCDERGREDGFIHRILFSFPDPVPRVMTAEGLRPEALSSYCEVFNKLRALRLNPMPGRTFTRVLAPDAFPVFRDWANQHYAEMDSTPTNLHGPWAKLVTYCARLALIIHLTRKVCGESVSGEVDTESVSRAIALVSYFKSHTRKVYHQLYASPEERQIAAAVEWLKKRPGYVASRHDFVTYKVAGVRTSGEAQAIFRMLEDNGWGRIEQRTPVGGGPQSIRFVLNCRPTADRLQTLPGGRK